MSEQQTIPTTDDRVQFLAAETGETPEEILQDAAEFAAEDGITVDQELTNGVALMEEVEAEFAELSTVLGDGTGDDGQDW